jgi:hypothetical protein
VLGPRPLRAQTALTIRARRVAPWLVLALWPVALALANPKWLYNGPIVDTYIYLGAFLRLPVQLSQWANLYFYSRLAFILPGYIAYQHLPPLWANALLDFGYFYGFILVLYALLRRQVGPRAAIVSALLIGGYSHFLEAIGWDYVDGAGAMYLLLAVWAVSRSLASPRWWLWLLLAGLALGAGLHTHIFTLALWPVVGLFLGLRWPSGWRWPRLLAAGLLLAAGVALTTGLLIAASLALGGPAAFFMSSVNFLQYYTSLSTNPWLTKPMTQLLPSASWLVLPAILVVTALAGNWQARGQWRSWARSASGALVLTYLAAAASMALISTQPDSPVLKTGSYVGYLIPFMALALGASAAPALDRLPVQQWRVLLVAVIVSVPAAIVLGGWLAAGLAGVVAHESAWVMLAALAAALGLLALRRGDFASLMVGVLAFAAANPFGPSPDTALLVRDASVRRDTFLKVVETVRAVDANWPGQPAWLWFNDQEDVAYRLTACALAACDRLVISREFPSLSVDGVDQAGAARLVPGQRVLVLSRQADALTLVSGAVSGLAPAPLPERLWTNTAGQMPFAMHFLQEPAEDWHLSLPPAAWLAFQPGVATAEADGSYRADPANGRPGFMAFGPYIKLPPGQYAATFWLSAPPSTTSGQVARLDVAVVNPNDFTGGARTLQVLDFSGKEAPQPFRLVFSSGSASNAVEFRVQTFSKIPLTLSRVQVERLDAGPLGSQTVP